MECFKGFCIQISNYLKNGNSLVSIKEMFYTKKCELKHQLLYTAQTRIKFSSMKIYLIFQDQKSCNQPGNKHK